MFKREPQPKNNISVNTPGIIAINIKFVIGILLYLGPDSNEVVKIILCAHLA
jgi:hypothetical protein